MTGLLRLFSEHTSDGSTDQYALRCIYPQAKITQLGGDIGTQGDGND
jgi:hypothetical protein